MTLLKNWKRQEEHIFPCDCGDGHYLRIRWDDDDYNFRYLWLEADNYRYKKLKSRLKDAWKIVVGKPCTVAEVVLDESVCVELRDFLDTKLNNATILGPTNFDIDVGSAQGTATPQHDM